MSLEEATRALRDEGAMEPLRKRALRDRVLHAPRKRSMRALRWAMPIAAVLVGASVWASVARRHPEIAPVAPVIATTAAPVNASVSAPVVAPVVEEAQPAHVMIAKSPTVKVPTMDDAERRALRAYRDAERLQFDEKDWARALEAWDRYLPLAGASPLVVDARYDRALCLIHLGRTDEARAALEPFARGEVGAYRRDEAQSLLRTLR